MKNARLTAAALLLISAPLQASDPPATLPKAFLAQLPLLMNLSDQEFEGLLATAQQQNSDTESAPHTGREEKNDDD